jgi:hypothetical protein
MIREDLVRIVLAGLIDVLCDTGFLPAPQLNLTTYSAPSRVSDPADWDEDLKIGGTLETGLAHTVAD